MRSSTAFDPAKRYIFLRIAVADAEGMMKDFLSILDTGAPLTEFSDEALEQLGYLDNVKKDIALPPGLQTQKYGKVVLPNLKICSHSVENVEVFVSHFERSWGIKALIGLDFLRRFRVTIDYQRGLILTEPFCN